MSISITPERRDDDALPVSDDATTGAVLKRFDALGGVTFVGDEPRKRDVGAGVLSRMHAAWVTPPDDLTARLTVALALVAQAVLAEPTTGDSARPDAAARRAWAQRAAADPGAFVRAALWGVVMSPAYAADGPALADAALLTIAASAVAALAA